MLYVNTSILVAYYCPEPLSVQVQDLLVQQVMPALSSLTEAEFFSAIAKKVRTEEIRKADGNRILAMFSSHLETNLFTFVEVKNYHWKLARGWLSLFSTSLRTLDALHLAIASAEGLQVVTADKGLFQATEDLGVEAKFMKDY